MVDVPENQSKSNSTGTDKGKINLESRDPIY